jgi:transcriptional regulator with XRE-family HTH domain
VSDSPATFGARIRELRQAAGMTCKQLAWHTGTTPAAVYAWEKGTRFPRDATLPLLAAALRTTVEALEGDAP